MELVKHITMLQAELFKGEKRPTNTQNSAAAHTSGMMIDPTTGMGYTATTVINNARAN
jgi:hypothetical protein